MNRDFAGAIQERAVQLDNFLYNPPTADLLTWEFQITGALLRDAGLRDFLRTQHSERWGEMNECRRRAQSKLDAMRQALDPEATAQAEKSAAEQHHWRRTRYFAWQLLHVATEGGALDSLIAEMLAEYDIPNGLRDELADALDQCAKEVNRRNTPDQNEPGAENTSPDVGGRLVLPDPMPDGTNPFLVIDWILFTGYVAARDLTDARVKRVEELGRKMRTEERNGVEYLHWEDDVDCRHDVSRLFTDRTFLRWSKALCDARNLCAEFGIPFTEYDPVLKTAGELMNDRECIIAGVLSDRQAYMSTSIDKRLHELAHSTTPRRLQTDPPSEAAPLTPGTPHTETEECEEGAQGESRSKGVPRDEAEIRVRDWLAKHAKDDVVDNPDAITRDAIANGTGVSAGQVSNTAAWKAFRDRRKAKAKLKAKELPLSDQMKAVIPTGNVGKAGSEQQHAMLNELIREQEAEEAEQERRHKRRHDSS